MFDALATYIYWCALQAEQCVWLYIHRRLKVREMRQATMGQRIYNRRCIQIDSMKAYEQQFCLGKGAENMVGVCAYATV